MKLRQDETDVNFLDVKPADLDRAAEVLQGRLQVNRRAWEKTLWAIGYVKKNHPGDKELLEALDAIRHHLEGRV